MNQWVVWGVSFVLSASLCGCSSGASSGDGGDEETASAIALQLDTIGKSGAHYRLAPAKFGIATYTYPESDPLLEVEATGDKDTVRAPVDPGVYRVLLEPGWQLQTVGADGALTPIEATLMNGSDTLVQVTPFRVTPVSFAFHLGASGIDIGVSVDEGIPAGYDALLTQLPDGRWSIQFAAGGGACCFTSVEQAQESYPWAHFLVQ